MSGPKCRTGQQPRPRPLVPQETSIRLWSPAAERTGEESARPYLPARLPFLITLLPPTPIVCWGQLPCKPRSRKEGPTGTPSFFKALSPRDTEPGSAREIILTKARKSEDGRSICQRCGSHGSGPLPVENGGGRLWPQEGETPHLGLRPPSAAGPARADGQPRWQSQCERARSGAAADG